MNGKRHLNARNYNIYRNCTLYMEMYYYYWEFLDVLGRQFEHILLSKKLLVLNFCVVQFYTYRLLRLSPKN